MKDVYDYYLEPPEPYCRTQDGLYVYKNGERHQFYDYDLYVAGLACDKNTSKEFCVIIHRLPFDQVIQFSMWSSTTEQTRPCMKRMSDCSAQALGENKLTMRKYVQAYIEKWRELYKENEISLRENCFAADGYQKKVMWNHVFDIRTAPIF